MDIDSVIERIKKAVRLARGTSEAGERETALRLARNLAERNGLAFADVEAESLADTAVSVTDPKGKKVGGCEAGFASAVIREHFGVIIMSNIWGDGKASYTWFGTRLNIDIARHVYHILIRESRKAWREVKNRYGAFGVSGRKHKDSFMRGFFATIWQKLAENPLRNDREAFTAEKKAAERKFEEFRANNNVKMTKKNSPKDTSPVMINLGMDAGSKVNLARPCEGRGSGTAMLDIAI